MNTTKLKSELKAKLKSLYARAHDIENVLSDPGDEDWEENAVEMENDEAWAAVGDVTKQEIREIRLALSALNEATMEDVSRAESPFPKPAWKPSPGPVSVLRALERYRDWQNK